MYRTEQEWLEVYMAKKALHLYSGSPEDVHYVLHSGLHTTGIFNTQEIVSDGDLMHEAASDLLWKLEQYPSIMGQIQGFIGLPTCGANLGRCLRDIFVSRIRRDCLLASPQKAMKSFVFGAMETALIRGRSLILCDDVLTMGDTLELAAKSVGFLRGKVLPYVLVMVNRSGRSEIGGRRIISLVNYPMPTWTPEECLKTGPCFQGSKAITKKELNSKIL